MLTALICNCHGAPGLLKQFLIGNHLSQHLSLSTYRGDRAFDFAMNHSLLPVATYIQNHGSYVILIGYSSPDFSDYDWVDINNASPDRKVHADILVERFA